jgi:uncharacterized protein (TIGR03437 family)
MIRLRSGYICVALVVLLACAATTLDGQVVHPLAQFRYDQGPVEGTFRLGYIQMTFRQSAAQREGLDQLLKAQRDPTSPDYHNWLTPEQYADRFGLTLTDLERVTAWLTSAGFRIEYTARGRDWIAFSGTAAQVQSALQASVHRYRISGETHFAVAAEPSIPSELEPLVSTLLGLNDFHPKAMAKPAFTSASGHSLAPGDLATIYDINALYQQGIDGSGQKIVIVGQYEAGASDIQTFRKNYGLGQAIIKMVPDGTTPGVNPSDLVEADLDLEWASAIARNATLIYVYGADADISAFYAIDQNLAPIVSESFGSPEACTQPSAPAQYEAESKKGNALGITWIAASGDSGAASGQLGIGPCLPGGESAASFGRGVSFPASVPEITAVGGTEFNEGNGSYWSLVNGANGGSALSYIPEMAWNDTVPGDVTQTGPSPAAGGGVSNLYQKPFWQIGPGVPADGHRDLPDIALAAANDHDPYNIITSGQPTYIGGTSAAAPVFAGMLALLNQRLQQKGAGNINASLYGLALSSPAMFHDVVNNNNLVSCDAGTLNCVNGTLGYVAGIGYDQATGLGSVDAYNLVTGWSSAVGSGVAPVINSVANAASYVTGVVSPGEMVVVFGTGLGPAQLAGLALDSAGFVSSQYSANAVISVQFNGFAAPLMYTSSTAIAAIVPYEITGSTAQVTVTYQGKTSAPATVRVTASVPGIFTADASGMGQAAAVNDGPRTTNSAASPAVQGSTITLYATGEGQTWPGGVDGTPAPSAPFPAPILPVSVTIGGVQALVQYAGGAFGEVAGMLQINVLVPSTVQGNALPVVVQVGSATTQSGVTIAVAAAPASGFAIASQEIAAGFVTDSSGALTCSTPPAKSSFLTTESRLWVFFDYSGAESGDLIASHWLHPSGLVDAYKPSLILNSGGSGCVALPLGIVGTGVTLDPGNWQVKVFRNGIFEFALPFTILLP